MMQNAFSIASNTYCENANQILPTISVKINIVFEKIIQTYYFTNKNIRWLITAQIGI